MNREEFLYKWEHERARYIKPQGLSLLESLRWDLANFLTPPDDVSEFWTAWGIEEKRRKEHERLEMIAKGPQKLNDNPQDFVTAVEAACIIGVTTRWIAKLVENGKLRARHIGERVGRRRGFSYELRIYREDVYRFKAWRDDWKAGAAERARRSGEMFWQKVYLDKKKRRMK